jgi:hypothetical protein
MSALVGKPTLAFTDGEIVLGYEPKFRQSEITSAITPASDIRPKTSVLTPTAEVVKDWQNVLQIDRNEISIDCDDFRYQA